MSSQSIKSSSSLEKGVQPIDEKSVNPINEDPDAEFGGAEARKQLERKLLWKIDLRMSIMIIIYILNYVGFIPFLHASVKLIRIGRLPGRSQ